MECLKQYDKNYEGKIISMHIFKRKNMINENNEKKEKDYLLEKIEQIEKKLDKKGSKEKWKFFFEIGTFILVLIGAVSTVFLYLDSQFSDINNKINNCLTEADITEINAQVSEMYKYLYEDEGVKDQLGDINSALNIKAVSVTDENTSLSISKISIEPNNMNYLAASFTPDTYIGKDYDDNIYIAKDYINQPILLTYKEGNKEVYFFGQYNKAYHWDGYCVTNTYNEDGSLFGICESNFDDGKRLDYKSLYSNDSSEWHFADKKCEESSNIGFNIICTDIQNKTKNFTSTNVRVYDILYVDNLLQANSPKILRYYHGNTLNELYNDNTGQAYLAIYNDDGTIKTLYVGKFEDGYFNDDTGNAWDIAYYEQGSYYVCNTGEFKSGHALNPSNDPIEIDDINKKIEGYNFECPIDWKTE